MGMADSQCNPLESERIRSRLADVLKQTIRRARLSHGLTQEQVAEALEVDPATVRRWELGLRIPRLGDLEVLAHVIDLPRLVDVYEKYGNGQATYDRQ